MGAPSTVPENVLKKQKATEKINAEAATAAAAAKQARKEKRVQAYKNAEKYTKKNLQIMRLRQMNMGVFMKSSKAATEMLTRVEPYLSYGYPSLKSVRDLVYKRGFGKINKNRIPLND